MAKKFYTLEEMMKECEPHWYDTLIHWIWYAPKEKLTYLWRHRIMKIPARLRNGFWPSDCWDLDVTFARFMAPRLRYLRDHTHGYPEGMTELEWKRHLTDVAATLDWIGSDAYYSFEEPDGYFKQIEEAQITLDRFAKYYMGLWD